MKTQLTGIYKNYTIIARVDYAGATVFEAVGAAGEYTNQDLAKVEAWIDRKAKEVFEPLEAFLFDSYKQFPLVTVCGFKDRYGKVWIKNKAGERSSEMAFYLFQNTPENVALIEEIEAKRADIKRLNKEIDETVEKLVKIEVPQEAPEEVVA